MQLALALATLVAVAATQKSPQQDPRAEEVNKWLADPHGDLLVGYTLSELVPPPTQPDPRYAYSRFSRSHLWNRFMGWLYPPADGPILNANHWEPASNDSYKLGEAWLWGLTGLRDPAVAIEHYKAAAAIGDDDALFSLGVAYSTGGFLCPEAGVAENQALAIVHYTIAAEQGCFQAQMALAYRYMFGWHVPQNFTRALSYLLPAASMALELELESYPYFTLSPRNSWTLGAEYGTGLYGDGVYLTHDMSRSEFWYIMPGGESPARSLRMQISVPTWDNGVDTVDSFVDALIYQAFDDSDPKAFWALARLYGSGLSLNEPQWDKAIFYASECRDTSSPGTEVRTLCDIFLAQRLMRGEGTEQELGKAAQILESAKPPSLKPGSATPSRTELEWLRSKAELEWLQGNPEPAIALASVDKPKIGYTLAALLASSAWWQYPATIRLALEQVRKEQPLRAPIANLLLGGELAFEVLNSESPDPRKVRQAAELLFLGLRGCEDIFSPLRFSQKAYSRGDTGGALIAWLLSAELGYADAAVNVADLVDTKHSGLGRWFPNLAKWPLPSFTRGIDRNAVALRYFTQAAAHNNVDAISKAAEYLVDAGYASRAVDWWRLLARQSSFGLAYWKLGEAFENGIGVMKDLNLALRNYELALHTPRAWLAVQLVYLRMWLSRSWPTVAVEFCLLIVLVIVIVRYFNN